MIQDIVQPPPRPVGNPAQPPSHSACNPGGHPRVTSLEGLYVASLAGVNSNNLLDARTRTELSEWLGHDTLLYRLSKNQLWPTPSVAEKVCN